MIFIYNSLSILLLGILLNKKLENPKYKKIYLLVCFVQMMLIQGLRSISVGTDTIMYVDTYNNYLYKDIYAFQFTHFEYGFQLLYTLFQKVSLNSQHMLIIISGLTMFGFVYFIYKNSKNVCLSTFIFACMMYPNSFNIMRQYLAISIAINSYQLIINKKYIKASLVILIASQIHTTAYLMFIPLAIYIIKNWKMVRNVIIASSVFFFVFGNKIVNSILTILGKSYYSMGYEVNRLFRLTTFITILIAIITWYFAKKATDEKEKRNLNFLTCIAFVNVNFGILYLKYEFFSRIIEFLNCFLIISLPMGLNQFKSYYKPIIKLGIYLIPFLLMLNSVYNSGSGIEFYKMYFMT